MNKKLTDHSKGILINGIMRILNDIIKEENKKLCSENLHYKQSPLCGSDMFFKLMFMDDGKLIEISDTCKI